MTLPVAWGCVSVRAGEAGQQQTFFTVDADCIYQPQYAHVMAIGRVLAAMPNSQKLDVEIDQALLTSDALHWHGALLLADHLFGATASLNEPSIERAIEGQPVEIVALGQLNCVEPPSENANRLLPELSCSGSLRHWINNGGLQSALTAQFDQSSAGQGEPALFLSGDCRLPGSRELAATLWPMPQLVNIQRLYFPLTNEQPQAFVSYSLDYSPDMQANDVWLQLESSTGNGDDLNKIKAYADGYWQRLTDYQRPCYLWLDKTFAGNIDGDSYQLALVLSLHIALGLDFSTTKAYFISGKFNYRRNQVEGVNGCENKLQQIDQFIAAGSINRQQLAIILPGASQTDALIQCVETLQLADASHFITALPDYR